VLNGSDLVKPQTREAVLKAIEELNYKPDFLARNFRRRKTNLILVLIPTIANMYFSLVVKGMEDAAKRFNYNLLIATTSNDTMLAREYLQLIEKRQVDGAIIASSKIDEQSIKGLELDGKVVQACEMYRFLKSPAVLIDNFKALYEMTNYIIQKGKKDIIFIRGNEDIPSEEERKNGFLKAMADANLYVSEKNIISTSYGFKGAYREVEDLLKERIPDTIICSSDLMAVNTIKVIKKLKLKCPQDILVTGFDNSIYSQIYEPSVTTVAQPMYEIGNEAFLMLMRLLNNEVNEDEIKYLPYEIIKRESA